MLIAVSTRNLKFVIGILNLGILKLGIFLFIFLLLL